MDSRELETSVLWWNGPKWLASFEGLENRKDIAEEPVPEAYLVEMRAKDRKIVTTALAMNSEPAMLCNIIQCEAFSNLGRLLASYSLSSEVYLAIKGTATRRCESEARDTCDQCRHRRN